MHIRNPLRHFLSQALFLVRAGGDTGLGWLNRTHSSLPPGRKPTYTPLLRSTALRPSTLKVFLYARRSMFQCPATNDLAHSVLVCTCSVRP
ncbi:hypothetical protein B0H16DRAFT_1572467 [Mycena metata]|uniref:Uncharacterized protein n=1 Tax=Mycena metata TaxID=1033252 RepID=A0AAD7MXA4_9AGAR|nr:hypothetical protein B0H16DRAFT_1572467 [Mycena metata]